MAERDPRSPDPDDWFADPGRGSPRRARGARARADQDDWIDDGRPRARRPRPALGTSLPDWAPIAGGAVLVVIIVVGLLAIAGVFSGGTPTPSETTTQASTISTTPTTTPTVAPAVPAPTTTLKPGDTGAQVKKLQRALVELGYAVGTIDGDYGTATKTALGQFQTASHLTADGVFGPATRTALIAALKTG
jgi:hypothetical protein